MERLLWYGVNWHPSIEGETHTIVNPANKEILGKTHLAGPKDIEKAIDAASEAFELWSRTNVKIREKILNTASLLIENRLDEIAQILTEEQGKPIPDSKKEILFGAEVIRYYAEEAKRIQGSLRSSANQEIRNIVQYQPYGIAAAIVPWNYPVDLYCWKVGPALAAGCPMIIKPPHETPLAIAKVVECFHEAGLPPGVLNDLPGTGQVAGDYLARHPKIRIISATASVSAGQSIMVAASSNLKRMALELGGHSPFIVMPDVDIEKTAKAALRRSFSNMGQICIAVNRILIHENIYKDFVECISTLTDEMILGPGNQEGILYGPVLNKNILDRTEIHLKDALQKGAIQVADSKNIDNELADVGFFIRPSLVADTPLDALVMNKETYGPLSGMSSFENTDEVIKMANSLPFGLAAYLYSDDLESAWRIADQLEFGAVGININDTSELQAPFGGWKMSGFGRELGVEGIQTYLEPKHLKMRMKMKHK